MQETTAIIGIGIGLSAFVGGGVVPVTGEYVDESGNYYVDESGNFYEDDIA